MIASVPSKMALATSLASARVGRGLRCIESSICVAVITGLPSVLHFLIISFCTSGTASVGISTPRSPRATIKPSDTARISSILSTPSWFSILGKIFTCKASCSSRSWRISKTSDGRRTNEAAMKSMPCSSPNRISLTSFSVMPGRFTETPGTLTPFLFFKTPRFSTFVEISPAFLSMAVTSSSIKPSSSKILEPTCTSSISPSYVTENFSVVPSTSVIEMTGVMPSTSSNPPSFISWVRISGPFVSSRSPIVLFWFFAASRIFLIRARCSSWLPCEKFKRQTSIPFAINLSSISTLSLAGPIVHTILVFFILFPPKKR
ncbi:hypothetical protein B4099_2653 [Heyndrickxia coagulans]|uniref:Uncharacterized protein n=1 Tax=Heyndrickxia coagulans TaxID=1398 RepID=A0A150JZT6_HEYCO|nr:hypothetical protein B4099_2653 [Heyndrickxia coagulans]